ncbi:MAG: S8 family serine peptidase, partial [Dehalococcoidia bacterium]|nr:S8 family serine peptidase [Dehalococcoidia bacterium]
MNEAWSYQGHLFRLTGRNTDATMRATEDTPLKRLLFLLTLVSALMVSGLSPERSRAQQPDYVRVFIDLPSRANYTDRFFINNVGGNVRWEFETSNTISVELPQRAVDHLMQLSGRFFNIRIEPKATLVNAIDWGVDQINAERVWGGAENAVNVTGNAGAGTKVAVIDTGFDSDHPDLEVNIAGGRNFVANPDNNNYEDDNGHGTHVAGTIAAADNGIGLVGVAPEASLYGLKVLNAQGSGSFGDIVKAIEWATGLGGGTKADIINMSLGCFGAGCNDPALKAAVDNAYAAGVLVVVAAGNNGPGANTVGYPAMYDSAIAVAATNSSNAVASFSSRGSQVELAAPGVSIRSTYPNNSYATLNGTSMATPHVAGLAALVKAANPSITASQIRTRLQQTATDLGAAGRDTSYGYGLIDAVAAVGGEAPPPPPPSAPFVSCTAQAAVTSSAGDNNGYQTTPANACADGGEVATDTNSGSGTSTSCTSTQKDKHNFY